MSLSFKPELMRKVLAGEKTVTRRDWPTNYAIGQEVAIVPGMGRISCGRVLILDVEPRTLMFDSHDDFVAYWKVIHGKEPDYCINVARIQFKLIEVRRTICPTCDGIGTRPFDSDHHPLTTLDDLPTDELEALYELTGVQRADRTSPELHRARKWLSDAVYERKHGPIKRYAGPVPGELHVHVVTGEEAENRG